MFDAESKMAREMLRFTVETAVPWGGRFCGAVLGGSVFKELQIAALCTRFAALC